MPPRRLTTPTPTMVYAGEQPAPPEVDKFVEALVARPEIMAAALDIVVTEPVPTERIVGFLAGSVERREARTAALKLASTFLGATVSGRFKYDRPTETAMSKDTVLAELLRQHRATERNPDRQAEVTRKIRARQFYIFAKRLETSNGAHSSAA